MTNQIICSYVTVPDKETAEAIARTVVEERLAACVNLFDGVTSFFRWNDKTDVAQEVVLVLKTNQESVSELTARILELHPYECPCVVSWNIDQGAPAFLDWVCKETKTPHKVTE